MVELHNNWCAVIINYEITLQSKLFTQYSNKSLISHDGFSKIGANRVMQMELYLLYYIDTNILHTEF